jgi:hypothetical protein
MQNVENLLTIVGQSGEGTLHGGCGQARAGTVALITFGAHLEMGVGRVHLRIQWKVMVLNSYE